MRTRDKVMPLAGDQGRTTAGSTFMLDPTHNFNTPGEKSQGLRCAPYQSHKIELLALADLSLAEAQQYRAEWLSSGDGLSWRQWQAALQDREVLLSEVTGL